LCSCIGRLVPFISESFRPSDAVAIDQSGEGYLIEALHELVNDRDVDVSNAAVVSLSSILGAQDPELINLSVKARESFELFAASCFDVPVALFDRFEAIGEIGGIFSRVGMEFDLWISWACVSLLKLFESGSEVLKGVARVCECM
jgi:hypothetical protein